MAQMVVMKSLSSQERSAAGYMQDQRDKIPWMSFWSMRMLKTRSRGPTSHPLQDRKMALHLHMVTGHRSPLRLARALVITGASPSLIRAAKELKCEVCHEIQPVKTRRPASIPRARNFGDRVYADLMSVQDRQGSTFWICHAVDACTRYQVARVLSGKSASEVIKFFEEAWFQPLGVPAALTVGMGTEFIAEGFIRFLEFHDVAVYHIPVEAPWENGIAERAGGALKVVLKATMHQMAALGEEDVRSAVTATLEAVNGDIVTSGGYSPAQMVLGKQPRVTGAGVSGDMRSSLPSLSLQLNEPDFARLAAMREMAKLAMVRLHYSQALKRASVARPRVQADWGRYAVGDVVYFFREQKATAKKKGSQRQHRRRLQLRSWHGPGVLLALEGGNIPVAGYVAYRGNVTKVALEHLRHASAMERLAATDWEAILDDVIRGSELDRQVTGPGEVAGDGVDPPQGEPVRGALPAPRRRQVVFETHRREQPERTVVFPYPYPQELDTSRQTSVAATPGVSQMSSRMPSRQVSQQLAGASESTVPVQQFPPIPEPEEPLQPVEDTPAPVPGAGPSEEADGEARSSRRLERAHGAVRRALSEPGTGGDASRRRIGEPIRLSNGRVIDALMTELQKQHPLVVAATWAEQDAMEGYLIEQDHGSWDGRWTRPSSWEYEAMCARGGRWPSGSGDHDLGFEALTTAASGKELRWSEMDEETRESFAWRRLINGASGSRMVPLKFSTCKRARLLGGSLRGRANWIESWSPGSC